MKKVWVKFLSLMTVLVVGFSLPAAASGTSPMLLPLADEEVLIYSAENEKFNDWGSRFQLQPAAPDSELNREPWIDCPTIDDPVCDFNKPGYTPLYWLTLPNCEVVNSENCLEGFAIRKDGVLQEAEYLGPVPAGEGFPGNPSIGLIEGGVASLYRVPGAPHSGGDIYAVTAQGSQDLAANKTSFRTGELYIYVFPVSIESPAIAEQYPGTMVCMWGTADTCGFSRDFDLEVRPQVTVRVTNEVGGWFLGRMKAPEISVTPISNKSNRIVVEAAPVEVARFGYKTKKSDLTLQDRIATGNSGSFGALDGQGSVRIGNGGYDTSNFGMISYFRNKVNDTAIGTTTHWGIRTTDRDDGNRCLADKTQVLGIVSTNSMVYDGFSPRFNNGFLDYRVGGLHLMPDGKTPVLGTYDLVMRSETARCLYGFSKAPLSATVTVTGTGDLNVASTVVSEKDGWLKLAAYGFTFSEKNIKVKVTQAQTRTLTKSTARTVTLTSKQRAEVKAVLAKSSGNTKFICTGTFVRPADRALALQRARAACNYAKAQNKNYSFFAQAKVTKAASFDGRVMLNSK